MCLSQRANGRPDALRAMQPEFVSRDSDFTSRGPSLSGCCSAAIPTRSPPFEHTARYPRWISWPRPAHLGPRDEPLDRLMLRAAQLGRAAIRPDLLMPRLTTPENDTRTEKPVGTSTWPPSAGSS